MHRIDGCRDPPPRKSPGQQKSDSTGSGRTGHFSSSCERDVVQTTFRDCRALNRTPVKPPETAGEVGQALGKLAPPSVPSSTTSCIDDKSRDYRCTARREWRKSPEAHCQRAVYKSRRGRSKRNAAKSCLGKVSHIHWILAHSQGEGTSLRLPHLALPTLQDVTDGKHPGITEPC